LNKCSNVTPSGEVGETSDRREGPSDQRRESRKELYQTNVTPSGEVGETDGRREGPSDQRRKSRKELYQTNVTPSGEVGETDGRRGDRRVYGCGPLR
jgi:hypothetical protein